MEHINLYLVAALGVILLLSAAQTFFFLSNIQKLIDKVMSRSYTEYIKAGEPPAPRFQFNQDAPEDLRSLQEFKIV